MTTTFKKIVSIGALFLLSLGLAACSSKPAKLPAPAKTLMAIPKGRIAEWRAELKPYHVRLIKQGRRLKWVVPVDGFFYAATDELRPTSFPILLKIATMVNQYTNSTAHPFPVKVFGHADNVLGYSARQRLSKDYALAITSFLWQQGFTHQQLMIRGKSIKLPIAPQNTVLGRHYNRRVVIQVH